MKGSKWPFKVILVFIRNIVEKNMAFIKKIIKKRSYGLHAAVWCCPCPTGHAYFQYIRLHPCLSSYFRWGKKIIRLPGQWKVLTISKPTSSEPLVFLLLPLSSAPTSRGRLPLRLPNANGWVWVWLCADLWIREVPLLGWLSRRRSDEARASGHGVISWKDTW
jgi:hypothetical protein